VRELKPGGGKRGLLGDFVMAFNIDRRLKTVEGLTPYEYIH
jgi:hypothetical protein